MEWPAELLKIVSKIKDKDLLLISLPFLILNFFGSGYLFLWANYNFNLEILSNNGIIILAFILSAIIFILFLLGTLGYMYFYKMLFLDSKKVAFWMNFLSGYFFIFVFFTSVYFSILKYQFLQKFVIIYLIVVVIGVIAAIIRKYGSKNQKKKK